MTTEIQHENKTSIITRLPKDLRKVVSQFVGTRMFLPLNVRIDIWSEFRVYKNTDGSFKILEDRLDYRRGVVTSREVMRQLCLADRQSVIDYLSHQYEFHEASCFYPNEDTSEVVTEFSFLKSDDENDHVLKTNHIIQLGRDETPTASECNVFERKLISILKLLGKIYI